MLKTRIQFRLARAEPSGELREPGDVAVEQGESALLLTPAAVGVANPAAEEELGWSLGVVFGGTVLWV